MAFPAGETDPRSGARAKGRLEIQVYKQLRDKIRFGTYAIGQRLPSENELSEEHGVSRPVVRAALAKLRDSGLIVSRQGAGSFVNDGPDTHQNGFTALSSIADISQYFQFRRLIEARTAELAARNADARGIGRLRGVLDEIELRLNRGEDAVTTDFAFHTTLAELSDSRFLIETVEMLRPHWVFVGNFLRSLGASGDRTGRRMNNEHKAIVEAIAANDPEAAQAAMLAHIEGSENRVFKGER